MNVVFVGIGLSMVAVASGLAGIGHYDGILGAEDPAAFLQGERSGTFRVKVVGTTADAERAFSNYEQQLVLTEKMRDDISSRQFVPVEIIGEEPQPAFMEVRQSVPEPGATLVVSGTVRTEWALFDTGTQTLPSMPVLFIQPTEYHEPLLFKR